MQNSSYDAITGSYQCVSYPYTIVHHLPLVNTDLSLGHTGIRGNERADEAAKATLNSTVSTTK